jgi:nitric oxide dioxygenase
MTPEQIELVQKTLSTARPLLDRIAADFYRRMMAADEHVGRLFITDPEVQQAKFAAELEVLVGSIRDHDALMTRTAVLGVTHRDYGVRAADYRVAGAALLDALADSLGPDWTQEVAEAWRVAYSLMSEAMMGAQDRVGPQLDGSP